LVGPFNFPDIAAFAAFELTPAGDEHALALRTKHRIVFVTRPN
jgi:hypothetical protein